MKIHLLQEVVERYTCAHMGCDEVACAMVQTHVPTGFYGYCTKHFIEFLQTLIKDFTEKGGD